MIFWRDSVSLDEILILIVESLSSAIIMSWYHQPLSQALPRLGRVDVVDWRIFPLDRCDDLRLDTMRNRQSRGHTHDCDVGGGAA